MQTQPIAQQIHAVIGVIKTVGELIQNAKEIPSGHLYAMLCGTVDLATYQRIIKSLKDCGLVQESGMHMLIWTGPNSIPAVANVDRGAMGVDCGA